MGANLVMQVFAGWTHVSDRAFRVLVRMAVTALDNPGKGQPAGIYHGGRELLAMSLRSEGSDETKFRAVKRAVAELTEAGAIDHIATGWAGQNAVYRLTLSRPGSTVDSAEMGGLIGPPKGGRTSPPMGGQNGPEWGAAQTPPRNQEEPIEERGEEEGADLQTASHPPRESEPSEPAPVVELFKGVTGEAPYRSPPSIVSRWRNRHDPVADAMERQAAKRAAYQAQLAEETS
jgi:hypothetical protein